MKSAIQVRVLVTIVAAVLFCSAPVDAIRSRTAASSLLTSASRSSDRTITRNIVNVNANVKKQLKIRGGGSSSDSSVVVTVIPDGSLPRALSGGGEVDIEATSTTADAAAVDVSTSTTPSEDLAMKSAKWNGLRDRVLSAIGMIAALIALSYYFKEDGLSVFVVVVQAMMYREMTATIGGDDLGPLGVTLRKYWWFATAAIAWNGPRVYPWMRMKLEAAAFGMTITAGIVTSVLGFQHKKSGNAEFREYIRQTAVALLSAALVVLPSSFWIGTLEEHGMKWIFTPAVFVAINDIMAYVFGKLFGKHALLPSISPNKTWEGFLGAAFSTIGTAWVGLAASETAAPLLGPGLKDVTRADGMAVATFASLVAPFAGFVASVIKRAYGRKDFGTMLPGHGGFVDRLDCQLILAPFVYFYLSLYKFAETAAAK